MDQSGKGKCLEVENQEQDRGQKREKGKKRGMGKDVHNLFSSTNPLRVDTSQKPSLAFSATYTHANPRKSSSHQWFANDSHIRIFSSLS